MGIQEETQANTDLRKGLQESKEETTMIGDGFSKKERGLIFMAGIVILAVSLFLSPVDWWFTEILQNNFAGGDLGLATQLQFIFVIVAIIFAAILMFIAGFNPISRILTGFVGNPKDIKRARRLLR